ncbi:MAG TPA: hypothetical protein VI197_05300 [Polyangiaceae bacterium]
MKRTYSVAATRAKLAGTIDEALGKPKPFVDGQVAAIAVTNMLPLVTADPKDFRGFKGLRFLNWASN